LNLDGSKDKPVMAQQTAQLVSAPGIAQNTAKNQIQPQSVTLSDTIAAIIETHWYYHW
jgi:hypothetical protein